MVSNLICNDSRQWDHELVHDVFNESDANRVLAIPLTQNFGKYTWMWNQGEKVGMR